jgi:hypothetical protein
MVAQPRLSLKAVFGVVGGCLIGCGSADGTGVGTESTPAAATDDGGPSSLRVESDATTSPVQSSGGSDATVVTSMDDAENLTLPAAPTGDGAPPLLWIADAAPVRASECKPGTYSGTFVLMVGGGLTLMGNLSITLVADKPSSQFGEFNSGILTVAPGAMFAAKDNLGDELFANISGQLDCGTRMFVGTLSNGGYYVFGNDAASGVLDGNMSATYDATASPPALGNGSFMFSSPNVPLTTGMGTWSATLQ